MIAVILIAAGMCLQGGEQVDVSRYVSATARLLELKVTLKPANGTVVVYSPGYEEQQVQFSQELSFAWIPFAVKHAFDPGFRGHEACFFRGKINARSVPDSELVAIVGKAIDAELHPCRVEKDVARLQNRVMKS